VESDTDSFAAALSVLANQTLAAKRKRAAAAAAAAKQAKGAAKASAKAAASARGKGSKQAAEEEEEDEAADYSASQGTSLEPTLELPADTDPSDSEGPEQLPKGGAAAPAVTTRSKHGAK
jgi:hypothetical protein